MDEIKRSIEEKIEEARSAVTSALAEHEWQKGFQAGLRVALSCIDAHIKYEKITRNKAIKLMHDHGFTLESIGQVLGTVITRERVRQIVWPVTAKKDDD